MFRNDGERRSFSVVRNMTVIGRREDCDLRIPVGDVSRKHCRLVRTDDGIRIEDLGSSNGTYVNGERIQESELNPGDTVGVGPVQFIIQIDGVPDEDDMSPPVPVEETQGHGAPQPPAMQAATEEPQEEILTEQHALEEIPAEEEEFQIEEEEPVAAAETPVTEEPLEELEELEPEAELSELTEEEPVAEAPLEELEESPLEAAPLGEDPLEELTLEEEPVAEEPAAAAAAAPAGEDDLEFELEEEPLEEHPAAEAPVDKLAEHEDELELDELELEQEEPHTAAPAAAEHGAVAPEPHAPAEPADALDELEFDEPALELDETAPAAVAEAPKAAEEEPLDLAPTPPAYAEVDIDSGDEVVDELELEDEPSANGHVPAEAASESSWDFVIEETDSARSHHDFKLDLDSPHEQPHGQA
jgi:hypothetical protein